MKSGDQTGGPAEVRCLLADDSEAVLAAVSKLLRAEGIDVVGAAHTGVEAVGLVEALRPDLVVLDARLPDLSGIDVAALAAELTPPIPALFYTSFAGPRLVRGALEAGGRGIVLKASPPDQLITAIRAVAVGDAYIDPRLR